MLYRSIIIYWRNHSCSVKLYWKAKGEQRQCGLSTKKKRQNISTRWINPVSYTHLTPEEPAVRIGTKVVVTTEDNFRSYVTISIPLPSGVKKSDITGFRMGVDSGTDLSLRLYAGSQKQSDKELTSRSTGIQDEVTGTSSVNVDGKVIPKTSHRLSIQESQSSWGRVKAGQLRLVKIPMDDRARRCV